MALGKEASGERGNSLFPISHNATQIRRRWAAIRRALNQNKVPASIAPDSPSGMPEAAPIEVGKTSIVAAKK